MEYVFIFYFAQYSKTIMHYFFNIFELGLHLFKGPKVALRTS